MSFSSKFAGIAVSTLFIAGVAHAQVTVQDAWVRATVPQQNGTGAFMKLTSPTDATLVDADSPVAEHVEIHEMAMDNHVMKMRQIPGLELPAGKTVELKPGGYHIMMMNLHGQVKEGDHVPLTLTFEDAAGKRSTTELKVPVRPLAAGAHGHGDSGHGVGHGSGGGHGPADGHAAHGKAH